MPELISILIEWIQKELSIFLGAIPGYLNYYVLRDRLPFFTLLFYLSSFATRKKLVWQYLSMYFVSVTGMLGLYSVYLKAIVSESTMLTGFVWRYAAPIQYSAQIIIITYLAYRATKDIVYSTTLGYHIASATGYIYETPFWLFSVKEQAHFLHSASHNIFFISYQILAIPIVIWLLSRKGVKIEKERFSYFVYAYFVTYIMASKLYVLESAWIARLPLMAYTLYLVSRIRENNKLTDS